MMIWIGVLVLLGVATTPFQPCLSAERPDGVIHIYPGLMDPKVAFAMSIINDEVGVQNRLIANKILDATAQVSSKTKYSYKIEVINGSNIEICTVSIYHRGWAGLDENAYSQYSYTYDRKNNGKIPVVCTRQKSGVDEANNTQPAHCQGGATSTNQYPPLELTDDARGALLYFVETHNSIRSIQWRNIPYDVTVTREMSVLKPGFVFKFSLRMVSSQCEKPDPSIIGKITLNECPPLRRAYLRYDRPKCVAEIFWSPIDIQRTYELIKFVCP